MQRTERQLAEAKASLEAEQAKAASRAAALAEATAQQQADSRVLEAARAAWAEGEPERKAAASLLEEARAEASKVKVGRLQAGMFREAFSIPQWIGAHEAAIPEMHL